MNNHVGSTEACRLCGKTPTEFVDKQPIDPCLGLIPGVSHACCGHGSRWAYKSRPMAYVVIGGRPGEPCYELDEYRVLNGEKALAFFAERGIGPEELT
jgi:hypothetical protein